MSLTVAELQVRFSGNAVDLKQAASESEAAVERLRNKVKDPIPEPGVKRAFKLSQQELANLQFQVNDMATGLASGQSPFTVMMQQGLQMSQMFKAEVGVMGALKAVGGGIVSFITNPMNLAVVGAGLAATAIAAVATAVTANFPSANDQIERHNDLIKHIGDNWDAAKGRVKAYGIETRNTMLLESMAALPDLEKAFRSTSSSLIGKDYGGGGRYYAGESLAGVGMARIKGTGNADIVTAAESFIASIREGKPDVMAFRDQVSKIATASGDPRLLELAQTIRKNTDAAAELQQDMLRNQDLVKGLKGDTDKLNEALGKGTDKVNGLTSAVMHLASAAGSRHEGIFGTDALKPSPGFTGQGSITGLGAAPAAYRTMILDAARQYGMDPDLIARQIYQESRFNPRAVSGKGAAGLMQLMPGAAGDLQVANPFDPRSNIFGGTRYMSQLMGQFANNPELALMAYNWGQGNVRKWQASGASPDQVPGETRDYVASILGKGEMGKASKDASSEKEKLIAQDKRWAEIINSTSAAEKSRAEAIGQSAGAQARLRAETELWEKARSTYGDRLQKDKALLAAVTGEINKQTAAVQKRTEAEATAAAMKEGEKRMEQERIAQMDQVREIGSGIVSTLLQAKDAGQSWGSAMNSVLDSVKAKAASFLDNMINNLLFGKKGSEDGGLLGGLGKGLMNLFTNIGNGPVPSLYAQGAAFGGGVEMFASGGTFTNSIAHKPTLFRFGNKLGVMGEKHPEAVMPLKGGMAVGARTGNGETSLPLARLSDGSLGVSLPSGFATGDVFGDLPRGNRSQGGGAIKVNAVTHNYSGSKAETKVSRNADGGIDIETVVGRAVNKHVARGGLDAALTGRFDGLSRKTNGYG